MSYDLWPVLHKLTLECVLNIKFFCISSSHDVIIVTKNGNVLAYGNNNYGCLGLGHINKVDIPQVVGRISHENLIDISYGYNHVLALNKRGQCFSWGQNGYGQLGIGNQKNDYNPKLIAEEVVQIVGGKDISLILKKSGELFGFGNNRNGRLGCGHVTDELLQPTKIIGFNNEKIVFISCGGAHSLALTETGDVYSWGYNDVCQLGVGNNSAQSSPLKIKLNNRSIKKVSCGESHSLLLTTDGDIYAFGWNHCGQIGNGSKVNQSIAVKIEVTEKFQDIVSHYSLNVSVAKAEDDYCYIWGKCGYDEVLKPKKTDIKSIHEIFAKYLRLPFTYETVHLSLTTTSDSTDKLLKIFDNPKYSDLKFKIEEKFIYVQKCIIVSNSTYFDSKFAENTKAMKESLENKTRDNVVEITHYSYDVFYAFLKYLYTDRLDIKAEKAMELLDLTNDYNEKDLRLKCVDIIKNDLTIENICTLYCSSIKYNLSEFEDLCFNFALENLNQIFSTEAFRQMEEKSLKKFLERAAKLVRFIPLKA